MTEICDVSFSYGKRKILTDFSLTVSPGECVVLAGSNGRGKSTALSLIAGVLRPDSGEVHISGKIAYVPQGSALFEDMTVAENLSFFASLAKVPVPDVLPFHLNAYLKTKVAKLSGGLKKQLSIACALFGDPTLILLDEPCAGLDVVYRSELIDMITSLKQNGREIVYVGHDPMEFYSFCDRVLFLGERSELYTKDRLSDGTADPIRFSEGFAKLFQTASV